MIKFKANQWDERALVERLSAIVQGDSTWAFEHMCCKESSPRKWTLDPGNNHCLQQCPNEDDVYQYSYRHWNAEEMAAFAVVLKWLLGVKIIEVTKTSRYSKPETT